jgi:hypothetical protein
MNVRSFAFAGVAFLTWTAIASAQPPKSRSPPAEEQDIDAAIASWAPSRDEFITPSARRAIFAKVARFQAQTPVSPQREKTECHVDPKTGLTACAYWGAETVAESSRDVVLFSLQTFPAVVLKIRPVPPTDYLVKINSDDCEFSVQKNAYRVPAGNTVVVVTRPGAKICRWEGNLQSGGRQTVECDFIALGRQAPRP